MATIAVILSRDEYRHSETSGFCNNMRYMNRRAPQGLSGTHALSHSYIQTSTVPSSSGSDLSPISSQPGLRYSTTSQRLLACPSQLQICLELMLTLSKLKTKPSSTPTSRGWRRRTREMAWACRTLCVVRCCEYLSIKNTSCELASSLLSRKMDDADL